MNRAIRLGVGTGADGRTVGTYPGNAVMVQLRNGGPWHKATIASAGREKLTCRLFINGKLKTVKRTPDQITAVPK